MTVEIARIVYVTNLFSFAWKVGCSKAFQVKKNLGRRITENIRAEVFYCMSEKEVIEPSI